MHARADYGVSVRGPELACCQEPSIESASKARIIHMILHQLYNSDVRRALGL